MEARDDRPEPFARLGPRIPATPLVISVPHAGRDYPPALIEAALLPVEALAALEDRFADRLVADTPALGATVFVARHPRAWIDLNRDEREMDAAMIVPPPHVDGLVASAKVRGGLGLIPRRVAGAGDIWRRRLSDAEVAARLAADHRPWHEAIATTLAEARGRFGVALLIDLHSMPPLAAQAGGGAARIVLGDRYGRSCAPRFVTRLRAATSAAGIVTARNTPYAGGHTLDRHARPDGGIHALQIEIDRSLYLAADLRAPGAGMARMTTLVTHFAAVMLEELALPDPGALAAE